MSIPIPSFIRANQPPDAQEKIRKQQWEVRDGRILAVKGTGIVLLYGSTKEVKWLTELANQHNINILIGITDEDYNKSVGHGVS